MNFIAHIGSLNGAAHLSARSRRHAAWTNQHCVIERIEWGEDCVAVAKLGPQVAGPRVPERQTGYSPAVGSIELRIGCVEVHASRDGGELHIVVPLTSAEHIYFSLNPMGVVVSNDFRALLRWTGLSIDDTALLGLVMLGAIPAPLSLCGHVRRIPSGHRWRCRAADTSCNLSILPRPARGKSPAMPVLAAHRVRDSIDSTLAETPRNALLLFSGGVDSALLASRLQAMGRSDVELIHYSFGADDPETANAMAIARYLGLRTHQVLHDDGTAASVLHRLGTEYASPFCDFSVLPTNHLIVSAIGHGARGVVLLDGTGGDGAFGVGAKAALWRRVFRLPHVARSLISLGLGRAALRPWHYGRTLDLVYRTTKRSVQWPPCLAGVVPQAVYDGVVFDARPDRLRLLRDSLEATITRPASPATPADCMAIADLVHVCAGQFAQKSLWPAKLRACNTWYPFLTDAVVDASIAVPWSIKCRGGEPKAILKHLLASHLPRDMVYRPKMGFQPPFRRMLGHHEFAQAVEESLDPLSNPLMRIMRRRDYMRLLESVRSGRRRVTFTALCLIWSTIFVSRWLDQIKPCIADR